MTAVEFLIEQFKIYLPSIHQKGLQDAFEQAKEMEKEQKKQQIMDAWDRGLYIGQIFPQGNIENIYEQDSEQYYNSTYKKHNQ